MVYTKSLLENKNVNFEDYLYDVKNVINNINVGSYKCISKSSTDFGKVDSKVKLINYHEDLLDEKDNIINNEYLERKAIELNDGKYNTEGLNLTYVDFEVFLDYIKMILSDNTEDGIQNSPVLLYFQDIFELSFSLKVKMINRQYSNKIFITKYEFEQLQKSTNNISLKIDSFNEEIESFNGEIDSFKGEIESFNGEISKAKTTILKETITQMVSIVSIFVAISFVMFGGMTLLNGLFDFSNMNYVPVTELLCLGSLIGIIMIVVVYAFMSFVFKILEIKIFDKDRLDKIIKNTLIGLFMTCFISFIIWLVKPNIGISGNSPQFEQNIKIDDGDNIYENNNNYETQRNNRN